MSASTPSERLYRYNVLFTDSESAWLDQLAEEIHAATGAKISRSEIVRAAIAGLRELHTLVPTGGPSWFPPLTTAKTGGDLTMLAALAARCAAGAKR